MKLNKILTTVAALAFASTAAAGEDGFKISGDLATSIFSESGKGNNSSVGTGAPATTGLGSNNGDFSVDMMELNLQKTMGNSTFNTSIGYGRIFNSINGVTDATQTIAATTPVAKGTLNLTSAYFMHKLGDTGLTFKLGKFGSGMGIESYNFMDNMNYTRSYAFAETMPWFFTGANVMYSHGMFDAGVTVANSTANTDQDDNGTKSTVIHLAAKPMEGLTLKANYLMGQDGKTSAINDRTTLNLIAMYTMNMMDFAVQYANTELKPDTGTKTKRTSIAGYAGYKFMDNAGAGLRYENYTRDTGTKEKITAYTLSAYYDVDQNARLKVDIGMQKGEDTSFADKDGAAKDSMNYYGAGFMYRF